MRRWLTSLVLIALVAVATTVAVARATDPRVTDLGGQIVELQDRIDRLERIAVNQYRNDSQVDNRLRRLETP
jgi:hypothetical protein